MIFSRLYRDTNVSEIISLPGPRFRCTQMRTMGGIYMVRLITIEMNYHIITSDLKIY